MTHDEMIHAVAFGLATVQYKNNFEKIAAGSPFRPGIKFDENHPLANQAILSITKTMIPQAKFVVELMADAIRGYNQEVNNWTCWLDVEKYLSIAGFIAPAKPAKSQATMCFKECEHGKDMPKLCECKFPNLTPEERQAAREGYDREFTNNFVLAIMNGLPDNYPPPKTETNAD